MNKNNSIEFEIGSLTLLIYSKLIVLIVFLTIVIFYEIHSTVKVN